MEASRLVSCREDISSLCPEQMPCAKYNDLSSRFSSVRKVLGDGNCFYRAFCFAYLESILRNAKALQRFKDAIIKSGEYLSYAGFDESSFKDHLKTGSLKKSRVLQINITHQRIGHSYWNSSHTFFLQKGVLEQVRTDDQEDVLLRLFNEQTTSDSVVQYLRLLTSAHLQNHADFFSNFVEAPNLQVYCKQEVEIMAMECDHVDILALSQTLDVSIHIVSMEGDEQQLAHHIIPEGAEPTLHLLYQTAHYDILYPHPDQRATRTPLTSGLLPSS